jgi:hypothetical protein
MNQVVKHLLFVGTNGHINYNTPLVPIKKNHSPFAMVFEYKNE